MATITKIDLTNVSGTLQGTFNTPFELTDPTNSTTLSLAAGSCDTIGGYIYQVTGGDFAVTDRKSVV